MKPTTKHVCTNCGATTRGSVSGVCNPLKGFVLDADVANKFGDLEVAEWDDVVECVQNNGGTITKADIQTYINDNTPTVESTTNVSTYVAPCAKPPKRKKCNKNSVFGDVQQGRDADSAVGPTGVACGSVGWLTATSERESGCCT